MFISSAFAQTAPAAAAGGGDMQSSLMSMLPLVLMFVVLYFVMIRPQMKKQKEHKALIDALAKGDDVATAGGLLGKVSRMVKAFAAGDIKTAQQLHRKYYGVFKDLFIETNPAPVKAAMAMMGLVENEFRLPMVPITSKSEQVLRNTLVKCGVLPEAKSEPQA